MQLVDLHGSRVRRARVLTARTYCDCERRVDSRVPLRNTFFGLAGDFFAGDFFAGDFFAGAFLAGAFLAGDLLRDAFVLGFAGAFLAFALGEVALISSSWSHSSSSSSFSSSSSS